jgi:hypothetical protein
MKITRDRFQIVPSMIANNISTREPIQACGEIKSLFDLPNLEISQCNPKCGICEGISNNEFINCRIVCLCCKLGHKIKKSDGLIKTQRRKTSSERPINLPQGGILE